ncbi:DUF1802 family protein [Cronbergia sp. UHCC 0137]|uniref:DUF1802 family protein n=1 Tax=Cronbergia sp. UHCC 0137 TaxID=3110239 RepID=UPI002B2210C5|nr:DUF1802 family protein [Cronbergia sp. UHCC 0137]MEA5617809.1 DUF1802 family protein [Cronbergia sp. UHCC 0137]
MNQPFLLPTALCLPVPDIEALIQGMTIAALPRMFIHPGKRFSLYPADTSTNVISIKTWAKCEFCQILDQTKPLDVLSKLTIWNLQTFEDIIQKHQNIFLAYLRVYHLSQVIEVPAIPNIQDKLGKFVGLPNITGSEDKPVLSDQVFTQRKHQLEKLEPSQNAELEDLQSALSQIAKSNPAAQQLENQIKIFLGWSNEPIRNIINSDLSWIKTITSLGDRSIEKDETKSNYQAGTDFEIITRKSLDFLGFKVEEDYKGGAGGLDLYCSKPYPLVCECKAGKSIPDRAVEELDRIGKRHLQKNYLQAVRLIIGSGEPTKNLKESAQISKISIIKTMTLQKLVELKAKYPGAINLIELKEYLEPGQIDDKINEYIDKIEKTIKLRSRIIQILKNYLQLSKNESIGVEALHAVCVTSNPPQNLEDRELYSILIELSSPLTGYLGRTKGNDWKDDKFYYLRDLPTN